MSEKDFHKHLNVEKTIRYYLLFLPPRGCDSILDIGSGLTAPYSGVLKRRTKRYHALDVRPGPKVDVVCNVVDGVPFEDKSVEWGWCSETLEHQAVESQIPFVKEVLRVCRNVVFTYPLPTFHESATESSVKSFYSDPGHNVVEVDWDGFKGEYGVYCKTTKNGRAIYILTEKGLPIEFTSRGIVLKQERRGIMNDKELREVAIGDVKPYPNNPRLNEAAVSAVVKSIATFGFQAPILVDEKMEILAGHTRLKAAQELQMKRVPVVISTGLTDEQKRAYRIADNKLGEIADWDPVALRAEIKFLSDKFKEEGLEFDLTATGFSDTEIELMLSQDVDFPDYLDESRESPESIKFVVIFQDVEQLSEFKRRFSFDKDKVSYEKFAQNCLAGNRANQES